MANQNDVTSLAISYNDPVESLLQYVNEIKPYHTKVLDVMVEYHFNDEMVVHMKDDVPFKDIYMYQPFYDPTNYCLLGYGDLYDEEHPWGSCLDILRPPSECEEGYSIDPWGIGIGECEDGEVPPDDFLCKNGWGIQEWGEELVGYGGPRSCERIYTEQDFDDTDDLTDPDFYPFDPMNPDRDGLPEADRYMITKVKDELELYWEPDQTIFEFVIDSVEADTVTDELHFVIAAGATDLLGRSTARRAAELLQVGDQFKVSESPGNDGDYVVGEKTGINGSSLVRGVVYDTINEVARVYVNTEILNPAGGGYIHSPQVSLASTVEFKDSMALFMDESATSSVLLPDAMIGGFDNSLFDVGKFDEII